MIDVLNDLATNLASVRAFRANPEAYLDRFADLTSEERQLMLDGDSGKVSGYLSGKANAETTIVVIILAAPEASRNGDVDARAFHEARHVDFWNHVDQRSDVLAA